MAFDVLLSQSSGILHHPESVFMIDLLQEVGIGRIQQQIKATITIPISDAKLSSTTAASSARIQSNGLTIFPHESSSW